MIVVLDLSEIITPTIVIYEFYKKVKREHGEHLVTIGLLKMLRTTVIPLDEKIAIRAADLSNTRKLVMANAIVYATAQVYGVQVVTSDEDFEHLPGVIYIPKPKPYPPPTRGRRISS